MEKRGIRFILNTEVATGKSAAKSPYPKDDQITGYLKNPNQKYVKAEDLLKEYDAVVLACGASNQEISRQQAEMRRESILRLIS